ncbi:hypothetical protein LEP1GSC082_2379 [Leptospira kirschneri str. H2]|uniref:Uncharacterized protein n=2 Tax=Leptospira kirschneri TaxID=29507 RepID=A0A0E2AZ72_9LEPT|nr:hypothetical protein LEP1GSC081_3146 [Leptospira kirschneri str. H1]EKO61407.1 hypothetical protein LEP1GSC082_2379 [Leptospira kirschneri str. H2]EMK24265.1 hypothetical protein LEP1GSC008_3642 [Leptospira kirschneri serovar Bulgarica str. Nikolaevo]
MISFVFRKGIQTASKTQGNFKFVFGLQYTTRHRRLLIGFERKLV